MDQRASKIRPTWLLTFLINFMKYFLTFSAVLLAVSLVFIPTVRKYTGWTKQMTIREYQATKWPYEHGIALMAALTHALGDLTTALEWRCHSLGSDQGLCLPEAKRALPSFIPAQHIPHRKGMRLNNSGAATYHQVLKKPRSEAPQMHGRAMTDLSNGSTPTEETLTRHHERRRAMKSIPGQTQPDVPLTAAPTISNSRKAAGFGAESNHQMPSKHLKVIHQLGMIESGSSDPYANLIFAPGEGAHIEQFSAIHPPQQTLWAHEDTEIGSKRYDRLRQEIQKTENLTDEMDRVLQEYPPQKPQEGLNIHTYASDQASIALSDVADNEWEEDSSSKAASGTSTSLIIYPKPLNFQDPLYTARNDFRQDQSLEIRDSFDILDRVHQLSSNLDSTEYFRRGPFVKSDPDGLKSSTEFVRGLTVPASYLNPVEESSSGILSVTQKPSRIPISMGNHQKLLHHQPITGIQESPMSPKYISYLSSPPSSVDRNLNTSRYEHLHTGEPAKANWTSPKHSSPAIIPQKRRSWIPQTLGPIQTRTIRSENERIPQREKPFKASQENVAESSDAVRRARPPIEHPVTAKVESSTKPAVPETSEVVLQTRSSLHKNQRDQHGVCEMPPIGPAVEEREASDIESTVLETRDKPPPQLQSRRPENEQEPQAAASTEEKHEEASENPESPSGRHPTWPISPEERTRLLQAIPLCPIPKYAPDDVKEAARAKNFLGKLERPADPPPETLMPPGLANLVKNEFKIEGYTPWISEPRSSVLEYITEWEQIEEYLVTCTPIELGNVPRMYAQPEWEHLSREKFRLALDYGIALKTEIRFWGVEWRRGYKFLYGCTEREVRERLEERDAGRLPWVAIW